MRDSNSFPAPKPKEVYEVQFRVISRLSFDCLLQGPLIKSYITRKPPIAPNLKQLSQLLLPAQPHGGSLGGGGDCAWEEEAEGIRGTGLVLCGDMS